MFLKRFVFLIAVVTVLFSFYSLSFASEEGISFGNLPDTNPIKNEPFLQHNEQVQNLILYPSGPFDSKAALGIAYSISKLPPTLLQKLNHRHVKVKIFTGPLTDNRTARHLKGVIPRGYEQKNHTWDDVPGLGGSRLVLVKNGASERGKGHGSERLELHEVAHSIDSIVYENISSGAQFTKLWQQEAPLLFPDQTYFINYPEEYFAETFALYYANPWSKKLLRTKAPETYAFIAGLR
ncbi:anthrax toxin lethal factor-related metalloendopeptidase [Peribacillus sp. SCS-155]|uniref:anthrax toxin lethal factor-related metalloendopeptidase n=1 Tax=Peribacillus sedimenti TaxID=3115297 RepID=UPI003905AB9D